jgi:linoleate 10R-lipoxygenase
MTVSARFYTVGSEKEQTRIAGALTNSAEPTAKIGRFVYDTTRQLIASSSFTLVGKKTRGVDIVRDVLKLVPVYWAAADIVSVSTSHPYAN